MNAARGLIRQTPEQRAVVAELNALRVRLGIGIRELARDHIGKSADVFRRLLTDSYGVSTEKALANVIEACRAAIVSVRALYAVQLTALERPAAAKLPQPRAQGFVETSLVSAVVATFEEAVERTDLNRGIILVGPTGAGKSECIAHVCRRFGAYYATGTTLWKTSLTAGMADIVLAGNPRAAWASRWQLQTMMFEMLSRPVANPVTGKDQPPVLFLDTFNLAGSQLWGLAFSIIDRTPAVVCLCGTSAMIDRACTRTFDIASQFMGRTLQTFEFGRLGVRDVQPLLADCGLNGGLGQAADALTEAANNFGRWRLVHRVRESLLLEREPHVTPALFKRVLSIELNKISAAVATERLRAMEEQKLGASRTARLALHETSRRALATAN